MDFSANKHQNIKLTGFTWYITHWSKYWKFCQKSANIVLPLTITILTFKSDKLLSAWVKVPILCLTIFFCVSIVINVVHFIYLFPSLFCFCLHCLGGWICKAKGDANWINFHNILETISALAKILINAVMSGLYAFFEMNSKESNVSINAEQRKMFWIPFKLLPIAIGCGLPAFLWKSETPAE